MTVDVQEPLLEAVTSEAFVADPYPAYARLVTEAPVFQAGSGDVLVTGYRLCQDVLSDAATFGQRPAAYPNFHSMDPPEHTRLRRLIRQGFTPRSIAGHGARIEQIVDELLTDLAPRGRMNLISDYALPLPTRVITEMLGVPAADGAIWEVWANAIHRHTARPEWFTTPNDGELTVAARNAVDAELDYFRALVAERRMSRGDDLISVLIAARDEGDRLTEEELLYTCILVLGGGHHTTVNLIGNGMKALLDAPDQLALLRCDPTLVENAVEEMLRFDPPLQIEPRLALRDTVVGGVPVAAGTMLHCILAAANRDPSVFPDPERFDITRPNVKKHLSFSLGIHHCLGAPLARAEGVTAVRELIRRLPDLHLDGPAVRDGLYRLRGLAELPVAWTVSR